jgi:hypothetical protein
MRLSSVTRRLLGALLLVALAIPLLPRVFGFASATVNLRQSGTFFLGASAGETEPISCWQFASPEQLKRNTTYTKKFFKCTNNWYTTVSISISLVDAGTTGLMISGHTGSVAPGQTLCLNAGTLRATTSGQQQTMVYMARVDQADLSIQTYFSGDIQVQNGNTNPADCT